MKQLIDCSPEWYSPIPVGDGIACGISFQCPLHADRRHYIKFIPAINPYRDAMPEASNKLDEEVLKTGGLTWTRTSGSPTADSFESLTLTPSIQNYWSKHERCCHWTITDGVMNP